MPEGPELHLSSLFINRICRDLIFSGKVARNPIHKCAEIDWDEPAYTISAESQGKELMLHLQVVLKSDKASSKTNLSESDNKPTPNKFTEEGKCSKNSTSILFTFGMSGKFEWTPVKELQKHSHLSFFAKTYPGDDRSAMALSFVDYRRFGKWYQNADWSKERGPCVMKKFDGFVKNISENLNHTAFERSICEVMLDQRFFSGIGNYLRAEILFRCRVAPFERAIQVLKASEENENSSKVKQTHDIQVIKKAGKNKRGKKEAPPTGSKTDDDILPSLNLTAIKCEPSENGDNGFAMKKDQTDHVKLEKAENDFKDPQVLWSTFSRKGQELLLLCHSVPLEVVRLGSTKYNLSQLYQDTDDGSQSFHDWLQCYNQDGMKNLSDHNKRTIWFSGPAGPLVPKDSKSRGKKTTKKASKDIEVNAEPNAMTESPTKKSTKGKMTRKQLEVLKHSEVKNSDSGFRCKQKGRQGWGKNTYVSNGQESSLKFDSKRKRKVQAGANEPDPTKKRRKNSTDNSLLKAEHKRITRSHLLQK